MKTYNLLGAVSAIALLFAAPALAETAKEMTTAFILCAIVFILSIWAIHHAFTGSHVAEAGQVASIIFGIGFMGVCVSSLVFAFLCGYVFAGL